MSTTIETKTGTATEREVTRARADMRGETITGTAEFVEVERDTQR